MIRPIIIFPDDRLTTVCEPVTVFDKKLSDLVQDLFDAMYAGDGIGLAAPQVGVLQRIFVMDVRQGKKPHNPLAFINPRIEAATGSAVDEEGCLSMPGLFLNVRRATYLHFAAQTLSGDVHWGALRGVEARVFQHELDHLDGVLFYVRSEELEHVAAGKQ